MLNQKIFIERAEKAFQSYIEGYACYLFYADIAEFQLVNRYYGMEKGDELLQSIELFLKNIPEVVVYERVLSDQFVFLAVTKPTMTKEEINVTFQSYAKKFAKEQKDGYPDFNIRVTCGIYAMTDNNFADAIDGANMARKEAKKRGSMAAVIFDHAMLDEILHLHMEEQKAGLALKEKRYTFFLQPKVNLVTGEIIGAEALARRRDVDGKIVFPDRFLQLMERNGTIVELDEMILDQVCQYLASRRSQGLPVVRTSVNLSRLHTENSESAKILHQIVQTYQIPPELIEFELTETILLDEFEGAKRLIDQLRGYQYHVSIDDFGSGYAGINIWQELNFDILKLDRKFLSEDKEVKARNTAIVPNVINIAQRLGIDVICEGVETKAQCRYLLQLGCTTVQGFYFSRPVPKEEFYEVYSKQEGKYPHLFKDVDSTEKPSEERKERRQFFQKRTVKQSMLIAGCAIFLALTVIITFAAHRGVVTKLFISSVQNNLDSYMSGQAAIIDAKIKDIETTMTAFAILIEEKNDAEFTDTYVTALNENNTDVTYLFSTAEQFEDLIEQGNAGAHDIESINQLKEGKSVISEIVFSKLAGDRYCFSIGVPVFVNGEFTGGLRAVVDANMLISTEQYVSPYGEVKATLLTDEEGNVLLPGGKSRLQVGDNLLDEIQQSEEIKSNLQQSFLSEEETRNFRLGEIDGIPYYVSIIDLKYNNWKNVIFFEADKSQVIIDNLLHYTIGSSAVLMLAILIVCIIISVFMNQWRRKVDSDAKRYLLLEEFSDTVLFDYDCLKDVIRFTPNASKLFHVQEWTHRNFAGRLSEVENIYPADRHVVEELLTGRVQDESSELRIRIKHSAKDEYYWCLIQYKFFYDEKKLASVVGKIVDIDDQQKRENQLIGKALRDGLTNLYNKSATQDLIAERIQQECPGLLFMIDIDDFKQVNDTYGHSLGDRVLLCVAECLKNTFRSNDIIGRIGGDELLVYMQNEKSLKLVHQKMQKLWMLMCRESEKYGLSLSVSVGIVSCPDDGDSFEALYKAADEAMYLAKNSGKRQYCYDNRCYSLESLKNGN